MTVGDHINIHGSMISYNIVKNKIRFKYTWVHKNDQNVLYALSSNYLSDKRRGKIRPRSCTAPAPHREQGHPGGRIREEKRPKRFTFLVMRGPPADALFASWSWPRHHWMLVGSS